MRQLMGIVTALALAAPVASSATGGPAHAPAALKVCESCVRAHMEVLAGDAMRGRQCGTTDEANTARYIEGELKAAGLHGGLAGGGFIQPVTLSTATLAAPATLEGGGLKWTHGQEFLTLARPQNLSGPLVRVTDPAHPPRDLHGAVAFYDAEKASSAGRKALFAAGAVAVIQIAPQMLVEHWADLADEWRQTQVGDAAGNPSNETGAWLMVKPDTAKTLRAAPDGAMMRMGAMPGAPIVRTTHNVVGVIHGSAPDADAKAILLTAHYDHLGVQDGVLFPGADDDASGTAAVMEFARLLGGAPTPRRTVYFALFGCEEEGGLGATYFRAHPPTKLSDLSANLEFEMIGLRDPKYPDTLLLTGWDRSNLGPTLAAHGAKLGPDHYPEENFFQRSDNYQLALKGVVAQTVGGWPVPPTYHRPTDTLASVDIPFMAEVIQSMAEPVRWLVEGDFTPQWNPGQKP